MKRIVAFWPFAIIVIIFVSIFFLSAVSPSTLTPFLQDSNGNIFRILSCFLVFAIWNLICYFLIKRFSNLTSLRFFLATFFLALGISAVDVLLPALAYFTGFVPPVLSFVTPLAIGPFEKLHREFHSDKYKKDICGHTLLDPMVWPTDSVPKVSAMFVQPDGTTFLLGGFGYYDAKILRLLPSRLEDPNYELNYKCVGHHVGFNFSTSDDWEILSVTQDNSVLISNSSGQLFRISNEGSVKKQEGANELSENERRSLSRILKKKMDGSSFRLFTRVEKQSYFLSKNADQPIGIAKDDSNGRLDQKFIAKNARSLLTLKKTGEIAEFIETNHGKILAFFKIGTFNKEYGELVEAKGSMNCLVIQLNQDGTLDPDFVPFPIDYGLHQKTKISDFWNDGSFYLRTYKHFWKYSTRGQEDVAFNGAVSKFLLANIYESQDSGDESFLLMSVAAAPNGDALVAMGQRDDMGGEYRGRDRPISLVRISADGSRIEPVNTSSQK